MFVYERPYVFLWGRRSPGYRARVKRFSSEARTAPEEKAARGIGSLLCALVGQRSQDFRLLFWQSKYLCTSWDLFPQGGGGHLQQCSLSFPDLWVPGTLQPGCVILSRSVGYFVMCLSCSGSSCVSVWVTSVNRSSNSCVLSLGFQVYWLAWRFSSSLTGFISSYFSFSSLTISPPLLKLTFGVSIRIFSTQIIII